MDTITQGLLGAVTAQLGFRQRIGRDATWVAAAAAVLPDLDIFVTPLLSLTGVETDGMSSMHYHRALSHSLLFAPILSLPVAAIWWRLRRKPKNSADAPKHLTKLAPGFWILYFCTLVAVGTHLLLDWCTSYGTQLLTPLSKVRYTIDAMPIIDVIYTPILILTLLGCWIARKISRRRAVAASLIVGWVGFLLSVGYIVAGRVMHDRAIARASTLVTEKIVRADAYPTIGTIFLWRVVIETDKNWHAIRVHHFSDSPPQRWRANHAAKAEPNEWIDRARKLDEYDTFMWFTNGRVRTEYIRLDGHHVVRFHDMRYSTSSDGVKSMWPLEVEFDQDGNVVFVGRRMRRHRRNFKKTAEKIWNDIWAPPDEK